MVMMHKIKRMKIVKGRFGRKKAIEVEVYAPSTRSHISEMAGHAAGVSEGEAAYATHTCTGGKTKSTYSQLKRRDTMK